MQSYRHLISRWLGHQQPVIAFFELQFRAILTRSLRSWILHTPHKDSALQNLCCNVDYKTCSIATNYAFRSLLQLAKELGVFHRIMHATYPWITSNPYWWSCVQYSNLHGAEGQWWQHVIDHAIWSFPSVDIRWYYDIRHTMPVLPNRFPPRCRDIGAELFPRRPLWRSLEVLWHIFRATGSWRLLGWKLFI